MIRRRAALIAVAIVASATVAIPLGVAFGMSRETPVSIAVRPSTALVPEGKVLRVSESTESGELVGRYVVDPARRVVVHESLEAITVAPFAALSVCDDSGRSEICGATLEVFENSLTYGHTIDHLDHLAGRRLERIGTERIDGLLTEVVECSEDIRSHDGSTSYRIRGFVDPASGLVVREEIEYGQETRVVERELVAREAQEYGDLVRSDIRQLAHELRGQRIKELEAADHTTYALKNGDQGLSLLWAMSSEDGDWCRLEYQTASKPGVPAASVTSWDLTGYPDYPVDMLHTLPEARVDGDAEIQRVSFRIGDTAVQVQVEKPCMRGVSATYLASRLVPSSNAGLK